MFYGYKGEEGIALGILVTSSHVEIHKLLQLDRIFSCGLFPIYEFV
jgi:hypothetical protein